MRRILLAFVVTVAAGAVYTAFQSPTVAAPPLSGDDAAKLRALIKPRDGEDPFDTIPWETSLWDSRVKAAAAGKPIILWEMDGHPLGCG